MSNPHEISLIGIGPLTNIALAIKVYPEIVGNIKEIFLMGGNHKGKGNVLPGAEFNFWADPTAAHIVLNSLKNINILTFECGLEESISLSKVKIVSICSPFLNALNVVDRTERQCWVS